LTLVGGAQPARAASTPPPPTSSRYISTTDPATAYAQGKADGQAGRRGATILDFGRPAMSGVTSGTLDFAGHFDSDAAILTAPRSLPGARTTGVRSAPSTASVAPAPTASVRPPPHCQRHPPRRRRLGGCTGSTGPKVAAVISSLRSAGQLPAQLGAHRSSGCQRHTCLIRAVPGFNTVCSLRSALDGLEPVLGWLDDQHLEGSVWQHRPDREGRRQLGHFRLSCAPRARCTAASGSDAHDPGLVPAGGGSGTC